MAISRSPTKIQAEHFLLGQCILIGILFINLVQTSTSHAIFHCVLTTNFTFCTSQLMAPHVSCQKPIPRWHARDKQSNPHELLFSTSLAVDMAFCVTRRRCECEYVPNAFSYAVLTTKLRQNAIYFHWASLMFLECAPERTQFRFPFRCCTRQWNEPTQFHSTGNGVQILYSRIAVVKPIEMISVFGIFILSIYYPMLKLGSSAVGHR